LKKAVSIALLVASLLLTAFAVSNYQRAHKGALLYETYFDATPVDGYATQRSLAAGNEGTDASILRQGKLYHQQKDYDLALMSLRAYLESNSEPTSSEPLLLAATAAMATGRYDEGNEFLQLINLDSPDQGNTAKWYSALLLIRKGEKANATNLLRELEAQGMGRLYPVKDVLAKLK
jgi:lipopolysaccharide biosynthesis regulator YciM